MATHSTVNNSATADLNETNLGMAEGRIFAPKKKELGDIINTHIHSKYNKAVTEGYNDYLSSDDVDGYVKKYNENPTADSFKAAVASAIRNKRITDKAFIKALPIVGAKIMDDVFLLQDNTLSIEYWLNRLLAEEIQAWYQYWLVEPFLLGDERPHIQETFKTNADDELNDHADKLLQRIHDLGFGATYLQGGLNSIAEYVGAPYVNPTTSVDQALQVMLKSEEDAIASYTQAVDFAESIHDVVSRDIFKAILADEEEHFANLNHFILDKTSNTNEL